MSLEDIIAIILAVITLGYTVVPELLLQILGLGTWKCQDSPGVAITFDDGPNPVITPQILDVLDRYGVAATFFVVGEKAAQYPDLIKLIRNRGHQVGAHSQQHKFAWLLSPRKTWQNWEDCITTLESLINDEIRYIRPPWGTFNLCIWLWVKLHRKQAVLWSAEGHDWQAKRSPEQITARVLKRVKAGSIVLLHDAGGEEGAPQNTLRALDGLCRKVMAEKKLNFVKLELP